MKKDIELELQKITNIANKYEPNIPLLFDKIVKMGIRLDEFESGCDRLRKVMKIHPTYDPCICTLASGRIEGLTFEIKRLKKLLNIE